MRIFHAKPFVFTALASFSAIGLAGGNVESMRLDGNAFEVSGWACDSNRPDDLTGIHVYRDDGV